MASSGVAEAQLQTEALGVDVGEGGAEAQAVALPSPPPAGAEGVPERQSVAVLMAEVRAVEVVDVEAQGEEEAA